MLTGEVRMISLGGLGLAGVDLGLSIPAKFPRCSVNEVKLLDPNGLDSALSMPRNELSFESSEVILLRS